MTTNYHLRWARQSAACPLVSAVFAVLIVLLQGCAAPLDSRKDAAFQSYAYTADRPVVRPTRSISSFSDSLMCMDRMLRESQLPTTLITSKQIPDFSSKVPAATKDMIITALSQMSRLSNAFRYVDYEVDIARQDSVQNLTTILLNNNQMQLQRPALYVSGAIAYVDQNVINNRSDIGASGTRLDAAYSQNRNATVIALELHLGDFRTRTLIPGLDSANEVIIGSAGQGLDVAGRIGSYGVKFNVGRDYSLGVGGALRTLVDVAMIEMVGKWARVPYWQCLTLDQTHPDFQRQMRDWYDQASPLVHNKLVQRSLIAQGYLPDNGVDFDENGGEFISALGKFQADSGTVVSGVVDFPTYERALRNFVTLGKDGKLAQIGWSSTSAQPVGASVASARRSPMAGTFTAYGSKSPARVIDMQIENVLVDRTAFEVGEQVFLSATLSRASYMYCFMQEAAGAVVRLLPNSTNPSALLSANQAIRIPDWMSPTPGFIMDATSPGTESVACFATDQDVSTRLPALLLSPALVALPDVQSIEALNQAFAINAGSDTYTRGSVQWRVVPKRAAAAIPAAVSSATSAVTR